MATEQMCGLLQDLYYWSEKNQHIESRKMQVQKCIEIVDQYNKYIPWYNAFANSKARKSETAQDYAMRAEEEFK